jgi:hypothetical protein
LRVAGVLEQVCVDVECDGDARVSEDAADLGRVEPEVDDQVAGEGFGAGRGSEAAASGRRLARHGVRHARGRGG